LPERGLLLGAHLPGDGLSDRLLHGPLRPGPHPRMAGAMGGNDDRQGAEDRPPAADLHRGRRAGLRADREALSPAIAVSWTTFSLDFGPPSAIAMRSSA